MILHSSWIDKEKYFFSEIFFWTKLKTFEEWNPQGIERTDYNTREEIRVQDYRNLHL